MIKDPQDGARSVTTNSQCQESKGKVGFGSISTSLWDY